MVKRGAEGPQGRKSRRNAVCAGLHALVSVGALLYLVSLVKAAVGLLQAGTEGLSL